MREQHGGMFGRQGAADTTHDFRNGPVFGLGRQFQKQGHHLGGTRRAAMRESAFAMLPINQPLVFQIPQSQSHRHATDTKSLA